MKLMFFHLNTIPMILCEDLMPNFNYEVLTDHSLSQQDVWAFFGHPNPQKSLLRTPKHFGE